MNTPAVDPEKSDIQRPIVYGYDANCSRHFILQVKHVYKARRFLGELVRNRLVTNASIDQDDLRRLKEYWCGPVNVGVTYRGLEKFTTASVCRDARARLSKAGIPALNAGIGHGRLEKLGLSVRYLYVFQEKARAFAEGAYLRAARRLADTGPSAAETWDARFRPDYAHVLISIYADEKADLERLTVRLKKVRGAFGLHGWDAPCDAQHLTLDKDARTVHFGFRDGISQPAIKSFHTPDQGKEQHEPGEFLLGYGNDEAFNPWALPFPRLLPSLLPARPGDHAEFFKNGSFAVLRKMEQDVNGFQTSVRKWARKFEGGQHLEQWSEYVMAKLCGRWPDGRVVTAPAAAAACRDAPVQRGGPDASLNDFDFSDDRNGLGCPLGAHIRRMNPRADTVVPFRRRPLMRRGMPYGPKFDPGSSERDAKAERGLLGLFFCASLEDQFEHLLAEWGDLNPMGPDNRGNAKDPLIGNHEDPKAIFDIPVPTGEEPRRLDGFKAFVTTRGTLYAFYPSLKALGVIGLVGKPAR